MTNPYKTAPQGAIILRLAWRGRVAVWLGKHVGRWAFDLFVALFAGKKKPPNDGAHKSRPPR